MGPDSAATHLGPSGGPLRGEPTQNDDRVGERDQRLDDHDPGFSTDGELDEAPVVPGNGALDHPASRLPKSDPRALGRDLALNHRNSIKNYRAVTRYNQSETSKRSDYRA